MDVSARTSADVTRTLYLPQTGEDGGAYVLITRPGKAPELHPCRDKEEACFWARRWMWRDRIQRWEGDLFGKAWIDTRYDH